MYVCVHICIRTRMSVTYILPNTYKFAQQKSTPHRARTHALIHPLTHARTHAHALATRAKFRRTYVYIYKTPCMLRYNRNMFK